jgi:hypothetical protein
MEQILQYFDSDKKLGMVAYHRVIHKCRWRFKYICQAQEKRRTVVKYPPGTMFIARAHIFEQVKQLNLDESMFSTYKSQYEHYSIYDQILYQVEVFIGNCANASGLKLEDVFTPKPQIFISNIACFLKHILLHKIWRFFYRNERGVVKIMKITIKAHKERKVDIDENANHP